MAPKKASTPTRGRAPAAGTPLPGSPAPTPNSAQRYGQPFDAPTPSTDAAPTPDIQGERSNLPPLPVDGLSALVERFGSIPALMLPACIEKYDSSAALRAYEVHCASFELCSIIGRELEATSAGGIGETIVVVRPPIDNCSWFVDCSDAKLTALLALPLTQRARQLQIHCVVQQASAGTLEQRNFSRQTMVWHEHDDSLPAALLHSVPLDAAGAEVTQSCPPSHLRIPPEMPDSVRGVSAAEGIVTQFERVVVLQGQTYSPMRLWTTEARKGHVKLMSQTSLFGRKAKGYLWIRKAEGIPLLDDVSWNDVTVKMIEERSKAWMSAQPPEVQKNVWGCAVACYNDL